MNNMVSRLAGALAFAGGVAWIAKVALIWGNGGTNTTDGLVGVLFALGAMLIGSAAVIWAWHARLAAPTSQRMVAALLAVIACFAAVNLPILVGWQLFGESWIAEEVGVLMTAVLALALGHRWVRVGFKPVPPRPV